MPCVKLARQGGLFVVAEFHNIQLDKRVKLQSRKSIGFPFFARVCGACFDFSISSHRHPSKNVDDSATRRWRMHSFFFQSFHEPLHDPHCCASYLLQCERICHELSNSIILVEKLSLKLFPSFQYKVIIISNLRRFISLFWR